MYSKYNLNINDKNASKLKSALKNNCGTTLVLESNDLNGGKHAFLLSQKQLKKVNNAIKNKKQSINLKITAPQIKRIAKTGGLFPLLALIPAAVAAAKTAAIAAAPIAAKAALAGAVTGGVSHGVQKAMGKGLLENVIQATMKRVIPGDGLFLKRGGCVTCIKSLGDGLFLTPSSGLKKHADGLYLKTGGTYIDASELYLTQ